MLFHALTLLLALLMVSPVFASNTANNIIDTAYKEILERRPTKSEVAKWSNEIKPNNAGSILVLYRSLVMSDELHAQVAERKKADALDFAYRRILRRAPDPFGVKYWSQRFDDHGIEFLYIASVSDEFKQFVYVDHNLVPSQLWNQLVQGHQLDLKGDYKKAFAKLTLALKAGADIPEPYMWISHCQQKLNDKDHGIDILSKAITKWSNNSELYACRGSAYILSNQREKAIPDLKRAVELDHYNKWAQEMLQICTIFDQGKLINKELAPARRLCAEGRWEQALPLFDSAKRRHPFSCAVLAERGECLMQIERYKDALADLNVACATNPLAAAPAYLAHAYMVRGECYSLLGDLEKAVADMNKSIEVAVHPNALMAKARLLTQMHKYNDAIATYDTVIAKEWRLDAAYFERAKAKMQVKDFEGAVRDASKAIAEDSHVAGAYVVRAQAYKQLKKYPQSDKDLAKARELGVKWENKKEDN